MFRNLEKTIRLVSCTPAQPVPPPGIVATIPSLSVIVSVVLTITLVVAVGAGGGGEEASDVDKVEDDSEEDEGSEKCEGGGGGGGVEVKESSFTFVHELSIFIVGGSHGGTNEQRQY